MTNARILDTRTSYKICIYANATVLVKIVEEQCNNKISIMKCVREGDTITPKLFTLAVADIFKNPNWDTR